MIPLKLFFLTNLLSPYRVEWLNSLTPDNEIDAFYLTADEKTRTGEWLASRTPQFRTEQVTRGSGRFRAVSKEFEQFLKNSDYDIYLIDGYSSRVKLKTIRLLKKRHKTICINIDGIDVWRTRSAADILKDRIKRYVFRSGAYFLCGSRIAAQTVVDGGADRDRVFVHPFTSLHREDIISCEDKRLLQPQYKQKLNKENKKIALAVGRFIPLKRYDCLIKAWKDMPDDCFLYLIGGGEERENYENLIRSLDVRNIELIDFLAPEKLNDYFIAADLFVHPSETETWGLVINEAMAKGCPVIATDRCVAGVELIRDGEEGFLTEVGGADALHEKMLRILGDDALRADMAKKAIDRIAPYTYENLAATHMKIFQQISR